MTVTDTTLEAAAERARIQTWSNGRKTNLVKAKSLGFDLVGRQLNVYKDY
ncbi:hypothetical protein H8S90_25430 [Olivibacter sp. SDN3]|nr:hypothetical protein [Olivibacter sp. SDN3]QNL49987.1 hypothetical protein H8S90_25430 [Olivibacter sp. SDN3]